MWVVLVEWSNIVEVVVEEHGSRVDPDFWDRPVAITSRAKVSAFELAIDDHHRHRSHLEYSTCAASDTELSKVIFEYS